MDILGIATNVMKDSLMRMSSIYILVGFMIFLLLKKLKILNHPIG